MTTPMPCKSYADWHASYHAALFESDQNLMPQRIAEAEKAIFARMRELFEVSTDHIEEDQFLDDALYGLRALRSCIHTEAAASTYS